jgi:general secretion pathway protein E
MTEIPLNHHNDFLKHLETVPPHESIHLLLKHLEGNFDSGLLNAKLIASFDKQLLANHAIIPLHFHQGVLYAGRHEVNEDILQRLQITLGCKLYLFHISLNLYEQFVVEFQQQSTSTVTVKEPLVTDIFQRLLVKAKTLRASDIHLEPQLTPSVMVRFRIDGLLHDIETLESTEFDFRMRLVCKIKVAANLDIAETRVPQDGRISEHINEEPVDLRVSTLPSLHGEKVVIRILPHKNPFEEMRDLGLTGEALLTYYNWVKKPQGMILITGQTGSGKTSTLYTTLSRILHTEKNIVTIEDPIEYKIARVTQVQVHPKVGLTFANGLRSILRQDPDIILLGEIRDHETAEIAYQSALTGHLVLSTLHTNDAPNAIIRLLDMNVEPYLIGSATLGVVAQRLLRKVCRHCAEPYTPGLDLIRTIGLDMQTEYLFYRENGCEQCFNTGYYGREGIFEVMPVDEELISMMQQKEQLPFIREHLQKQKLQTLFESAIGKLVQGLTTMEEIYRVVPPTQRVKRNTGSVFVMMLFLVSIFSVLVLSSVSMFEGSAHTLRVEKQSIQGAYSAYSALQIGRQALSDKIKTKAMYLLPKGQDNIDNPLLAIKELLPLFSKSNSVSLGGSNVSSHYQILTRVTHMEPKHASCRLVYHYQILASAILKNNPQVQITPSQQLTGHFQVEVGALPLSFFERYSGQGSISFSNVAGGEGPWYSPEFPAENLLTQHLSKRGYYLPNDISFAQTADPVYPNTPFQLPQTLWPKIGEPNVENNFKYAQQPVMLTAIQTNLAAPYPLQETEESLQQEMFNPNSADWAITLQGDLDRLVLTAESQSQQLELDQIISKTPVQNGYQDIHLKKTFIVINQVHHWVEISSQTWQITANPKRFIVTQKMVSSSQKHLTDHFSGLILVNGTINQLSASGNVTYNQPLTIFSATGIGLDSSITKNTSSPAASLGLAVPNGQIAFHPIKEPAFAIWDNKNIKKLTIEGALVAGQFIGQDRLSVLVKGSVAVLANVYPKELETQYDPAFYSLNHTPPFYPVLNQDTLALIVTQSPEKEQWQEVRSL